ncbi:hypothetical protein HOY80DRAFT_1008838 [Tuber brumale]|nr:hypothetical protein HOY80DRAFT_1008838 [Tuber brumale]
MSEVIASPPPIPRSHSQAMCICKLGDELVMGRRINRDKVNPGVRRRTDSSSVCRRNAQYRGGDPYRACPGLQLHHYRMIRGRARTGDRELPTFRDHTLHISTGTDTRITQKAAISDKLRHLIGKRIS